MDLTLDEHRLVSEFRRLNPAGKQEILDFASLLLKRQDEGATAGEPSATRNSCTLDRKEERPETTKEPLFTE
ncbi:hypothetical protein KI811_09175 [Geobacter hydrogenophilus]|uniref:Uncharacterized protein n=1 Tax=Geobacter hydrogenophilus TaxID=40983 RepID=A0A9W6G0C2_9BACT|nr:hypothetical protein [Geobacter hydrogenophilus]MBT0893981.1 hypothetical protein [Geobacter hydrogenophilus]GLI38072.1 hypothetical protein GHYDROH2_15730 [Geobacter hydrogenophilus]